MKHYFTDIYEDDAKPIEVGFAAAFQQAKQNESSQLFLLVDHKAVLQGAFTEIFNEKISSRLAKNNEMIIDGVKLSLLTSKSKKTINHGVLFGLEVKFDTLVKFESNKTLECVVYSPLHASESEAFVNRHNDAIKL